jgi:hypothetical protein
MVKGSECNLQECLGVLGAIFLNFVSLLENTKFSNTWPRSYVRDEQILLGQVILSKAPS